MTKKSQLLPVRNIDALRTKPGAWQGKSQYTSWRQACVVLTQVTFYGLPWVSWNSRQAVLFDLAARKVYLFGWILSPQDLTYLAILPVIFGFSLFLFTALASSAWWGYASRPTVVTQLVRRIERKMERTLNARVRVPEQLWLEKELARKTAKHIACVAFALWTGITFVGYFTSISPLVVAISEFTPSFSQAFWVLLYGFAAYGNTGSVREQVCRKRRLLRAF